MSKKQKRVSRRVQAPSTWEAMNQPVVEVTDEAAHAIFFVTAVFLLAIWIMPYLGGPGVAYAETSRVAGAEVSVTEQTASSSPSWYLGLSNATSDIGEYVHESFTVPFGQAMNELFDISQPVAQTMAYYEPGVSAVWNAWLELMADPEYK